MAKVEFVFDPFELVGLTEKKEDAKRSDIADILDRVSDFILESVLVDIGDKRSPVTGRNFVKLSQDYAKFKKKEGHPAIPNLLFTGDLLDSIKVVKQKGMLKLTVEEDQQGKADGHNNFSGQSELPRRPFIPNKKAGETFRPEIRDGIAQIINDVLEE